MLDNKKLVVNLTIFIQLLLLLISSVWLYVRFVDQTWFLFGQDKLYTLVDDAMISLRYAENLAFNGGLFWNNSEDFTQGYTNLGWTLYMSALFLLLGDQHLVVEVLIFTGGVLVFLNAVFLYLTVYELSSDKVVSPVVAFSAALFFFPFVFWSLRGMETGAVLALISMSLYFCIKSITMANFKYLVLFGVVSALAIIVRLDSVLAVSMLCFYLVYKSKFKVNSFVASSIPFFAFAGVLVFQRVYHGDFLPNTYYLKNVGVETGERIEVGLKVFNLYALSDIAVPLLIISIGVILVGRVPKHAITLMFIFCLQVLYSIYNGGDYAEPIDYKQVDGANRFISVGMIFLFVCACLVLGDIISKFKQGHFSSFKLFFLTTVFSIVMVAPASYFTWLEALEDIPLNSWDKHRALTGLTLNEVVDEPTTVASHAAGQIPFYSKAISVDLLGKSDSVISRSEPKIPFRPGHNKWDYDYSIGHLNPDVIADEWGELIRYLEKQAEPSYISTYIYDSLSRSVYYSRDFFEEIARESTVLDSIPEVDVLMSKSTLYFYFKQCNYETIEEYFFLHIVPQRIVDLPLKRVAQGFDHKDFKLKTLHGLHTKDCLVARSLPRYIISEIKVGQYIPGKKIWQTHIRNGDMKEMSLAALYEQQKKAGSIIVTDDVELVKGKDYLIVRVDMSIDTIDDVFIHVYPGDNRLLPEGRTNYGFVNAGFSLNEEEHIGGYYYQYSKLPFEEIDRIKIGQFNRTGKLWQKEVSGL